MPTPRTRCGNAVLDSAMGVLTDDNRSQVNSLHHNDFIGNAQNAQDDGLNIWDDSYPSGGNHWDDYSGTDRDGDGIGDVPYDIPGGPNQDRYPLMARTTQ